MIIRNPVLILGVLLALLAPPAAEAVPNDAFASAINLGTQESLSVSFDLALATRQVGEPAHGGDSRTGTAWWTWTAPERGRLELSFDENFSTHPFRVAVYTGNALDLLTLVGERPGVELKVEVEQGQQYRLALAYDAEARVDLNFLPAPTNDDFSARTFLGNGTDLGVKASTVGATREEGEPNHANDGSQGGSIWWEWEAAQDGILRFDLTGTLSEEWNVAAYSGSALDGLTSLAFRGTNTDVGDERAVRVTAGQRIVFAAARDDVGDEDIICLNLSLEAQPHNLEVEQALDLGTVGQVRISGDTTGVPVSPATGKAALWWKWTASGSGILSLRDANDDALRDANFVAFRRLPDDSLETVNGAFWRDFYVLPGEVFYFRFTTLGSGEFAVDLDLARAASNDLFAEARPLVLGENPADSANAGPEEGEPQDALARSLWWTWTAPEAGALIFDLEPSVAFSAVRLFEGSSLATLSRIELGAFPWGFEVQAGRSYAINSGTSNASFGEDSESLFARFVPRTSGNDAFADAIDLGTALRAQGFCDPDEGTHEAGEPGLATTESLWWKWTAPADVTVYLEDDDWDNSSGFTPSRVHTVVYRGSSLATLSAPVSGVGFEAAAGETIHFAVTGFDGREDSMVDFSLRTYPSPPPNDSFAGARDLGSALQHKDAASFREATREAGEPVLDPDSDFDHSLWWKWTAPADLNVELELRKIPSRGVAAVFQGASVGSLQEIIWRTANHTASVRFSAHAGQTYYLMLTHGNDEGEFAMRTWTPPPGDRFAAPLDLGSERVLRLSGPLQDGAVEAGEPGPPSTTVASYWWRWTAPSNGLLDYGGEVFTGPNLAALVSLQSVDPIPVTAGQEFFLRVLKDFSSSSYLDSITFFPTPPNDHFAEAADLGSAETVELSLPIFAATEEPGEPDYFGTSASEELRGSVWWTWTAPFDGSVLLRATFPSFLVNPALGVFKGEDLASLETVALQQRGGPVFIISARAGETYRIMAGAYFVQSRGELELSLTATPGPANDAWMYAADLGSGEEVHAEGSLLGASNDEFDGTLTSAKVAWWEWTAPRNGTAYLYVDQLSYNSEQVTVYRDDGTGTLMEVPSTPIAGGSGVETAVWAAAAGETYFLAISGDSNNAERELELAVFLGDPPGNDHFAMSSLLVGELDLLVSGSTAGATQEPMEAGVLTGPGSSAGGSVWWSWTAVTSGLVSAELESPVDLGIFVYTGGSLDLLSEVAGSTGGSAEWFAEAGTTYHLAVTEQEGRPGDFSLLLRSRPLPGNDDFVNRELIPSLPARLESTTIGASAEAGEPNHADVAAERSLWYEWTAPADLEMRLSSNVSVRFAVYTGPSLGSLTEVGSASRTLRFAATAGTRYVIAVDESFGARAFILTMAEIVPAPNDLYENRIVLGDPDMQLDLDFASANTESSPRVTGLYNTMWWEWRAPSNVTFQISVAGNSAVRAVVFRSFNGSGHPASLRAVSVQRSGTRTWFRPVEGETYYLVLGVTGPDEASPALVVFSGPSPPSGSVQGPPNDHFADRIRLEPKARVQAVGDPLNATSEDNEPWSSTRYKSVWWSWTAPETGVYEVRELTDNSYRVRVYDGDSLEALTNLASTSSTALFAAEAGVEYPIQVLSEAFDSPDEDREDRLVGFEISPGPPPAPNNDYADRIDLGVLVGTSVSSSNVGATAETGEPAHADEVAATRSVWWTWTAPATGRFEVHAFGASMRLGIYTAGDSIPDLGAVESGLDPVEFDAVAGTTYAIAADANGPRAFSLRIDAIVDPPLPPDPPDNDDFASAEVLSGAMVMLRTMNAGATTEAGEPIHHRDTSQSGSLWWNWTPSTAGAVTIEADNTLSTIMAVYRGNSLGTLVPVISNTRTVRFFAEAAVTYRIAVSGQDAGSVGAFDLTLDQTLPAPANDNFADAAPLAGVALTVAGTTEGASFESGEPNHQDGSGICGFSVWYQWTCPETRLYQILHDQSRSNCLAVYTGTVLGDLVPVAEAGKSLRLAAEAGTTYWIVVAMRFSPEDFDLSIEPVGHPENDAFADRIDLGSALEVAATGTTVDATRESGEVLHGNDSSPGGSVWWTWIAPRSGPVWIDQQNSQRSNLLAVYSGGELEGLQLVTESTSSIVEFEAMAGNRYEIAVVATSPTSGGSVEIQFVMDAAANARFAERVVLDGPLPLETSATPIGASLELGEWDNTSSAASYGSLWWEWTPAADGWIDFDFTASTTSVNGRISVGSGLQSLREVEATFVGDEVLRFFAEAGTPYIFRLRANWTGEVSFMLRAARELPPNDQFADALPLIGTAATGHNLGATREPGEPPAANPGLRYSVWWRWTAPGTGGASFLVTRGEVQLYRGAGLVDLEPVARGGEDGEWWLVTEGEEYVLAVNSYDGGDYELSVSLSEPGAIFAGSVDLRNVDYLSYAGSLEDSFWEPLEPYHAGEPAQRSVWFRWTAPYGGEFRITARGSGSDRRIAVYKGEALETLCPVADGLGEVLLVTEAGAEYRIAIDTDEGSASGGTFDLLLHPTGGRYADWRDLHFDDAEEDGSAPLQNPDGDFLSNLFELAFGKNPLLDDSGEIPFTVEEQWGFIVLSVIRPIGVEGVRYSFEVSRSLQGDWEWTGELDRIQWAEDNGDGTERFRVLLSDFDPRLEPAFFARLRIDLGEDPLGP